jgi:hypothetical protein
MMGSESALLLQIRVLHNAEPEACTASADKATTNRMHTSREGLHLTYYSREFVINWLEAQGFGCCAAVQ